MAGSNRGLGKGLEALFPSSQPLEQESSDQGLQNIALDRIEPNPDQPRKAISQEGLHELAQSISEQGLLQPLLVRPHPTQNGLYQLIAGERRWRACRLAGLHSAAVLVRDIADSEALVIGLVENLQRQDLNPVEEAQAMGRLLRELNISQDELAQRLGRSRSAVANCLRLLHLQPEILTALAQAKISSGQARSLLAIPDQEARMALFQVAVNRQLTVRQMEQAVTFWKANGRLPNYIQPQPAQDKPCAGFEAARSSLQKALAHRLEAGVRIKGKQDKGSITLAYSSEEELHRLVRKLGVDLESCFT
ncbi:MAG: ParB/RepB/Spo0J family partition protein [Desulfovermiculus sp.]|nr:ParB/RepB/Spo0J family partition protein [Desulfovermiculus sp.]